MTKDYLIKNSRIYYFFGIFITIATLCQNSFAQDDDSRTHHRFGLYGTLLGDPFPTLLGINLAYNLSSWMRINLGYGSISDSNTDLDGITTTFSVVTLGGGAKLFIPGWSFSPTVGINISRIMVFASNSSGHSEIFGINSGSGMTIPYGSIGFDWQISDGFNTGFGANIPLGTQIAIGYLSLGWFF